MNNNHNNNNYEARFNHLRIAIGGLESYIGNLEEEGSVNPSYLDTLEESVSFLRKEAKTAESQANLYKTSLKPIGNPIRKDVWPYKLEEGDKGYEEK
jgi:hypothetical protein